MSTHEEHDDSVLAGTIETMRWLHATAQAEPDVKFVDHLERQLMPGAPAKARPRAHRAEPDDLPQSGVRFDLPAPARRVNTGWGYRFASLAIILALIGGTIFATNRLRESGGDAPPTYQAVGAGSLETPTPTLETGAESTEWRVSTRATDAITADAYGRTDGLAVVGDILIRAWVNREASGIEALSTSDGSVLWTIYTEWRTNSTNFPGAIANFAFQTDSDNIYVLTQTQSETETMRESPPLALTAIQMASGDDLWTREFDGGVASFATGPSGLFVQSLAGELQQIDPGTGETIWTYVSDSSAGMSIAPYVGLDIVVVVSGDGVVEAIDSASGELIWRVETGLPGHSFSIAEGVTGSGTNAVAIRGVDQLPEEIEGQRFDEQKSTLMAVDRNSGDVLWSQILDDPSKGQMVIADGMIYTTTSLVRYAITNDAGERIDTGFRNWLVAIDLETGDEIWSIESDPSWGMAFDRIGNTLIMYRFYGMFVAIDLNERAITCDAFNLSGATSDDDDHRVDDGAYDGGMLFLSLANGEVMAVDPGDWRC